MPPSATPAPGAPPWAVSAGGPPSPPATWSIFPLHTPVHVVPAAQSCARSPLHVMWHATVPPHATMQDVLPVQSAVQPPFGQSMAQLLFPPQETVEPVSSESLQSLPPVQVTLLLTPVLRVHVLVPAQLDVQLA